MKDKIKSNKNTIKNVAKFILVLFLFFNVKYIQLIPIYLFSLTEENSPKGTPVLLSLFSNICLFIIIIILYRKDLIREWKIFKEKFSYNVDCGLKYWLVGLFFMMVSNIFIQVVLGNAQAQNEQLVQEMINILPWIMVINAGILAPIIEEITFRKSFKDLISNKILFVLISGIVFGSLHVTSFENPLELLYIIPYSSLGLSFAYMYVKTDSVYTSIFMHMFHNIALTLLSILVL